MQLRADLNQREVVRPDDQDWIREGGVERRLLTHDSSTSPKRTELVRYTADSAQARIQVRTSLEIFVLTGSYSDGTTTYNAGTYLRSPTGDSIHQVPGKEGELFVRSGFGRATDSLKVTVPTASVTFQPGLVEGLSVFPLHSHQATNTALVRWEPGTKFQTHRHWGGEEIVVLEGTFQDEYGDYPTGTWLRSPHLSQHTPFSQEGCSIMVTTGHLTEA